MEDELDKIIAFRHLSCNTLRTRQLKLLAVRFLVYECIFEESEYGGL